MNHTKREIIIKLETLSKIPKNGKLNLTANDIEIYQNSWADWFKRWSSGDGRNNTITHLNHFFDHVLLTTDDIISCISSEQNDSKSKADDLNTIGIALANCIVGMNNLRETYIKDDKTNAQIRFICEQCIALQFHKRVESLELYDQILVPRPKQDIKDLINLYSPSYKRLSPKAKFNEIVIDEN